MAINPDEPNIYASHDAIHDPNLLSDAIEDMPDQIADKYEQASTGNVEVPFDVEGEHYGIPPRLLQLVKTEEDPTQINVIDKRLPADEDGQKRGFKGKVVLVASAAIVLGAIGATSYVKMKKK